MKKKTLIKLYYEDIVSYTQVQDSKNCFWAPLGDTGWLGPRSCRWAVDSYLCQQWA